MQRARRDCLARLWKERTHHSLRALAEQSWREPALVCASLNRNYCNLRDGCTLIRQVWVSCWFKLLLFLKDKIFNSILLDTIKELYWLLIDLSSSKNQFTKTVSSDIRFLYFSPLCVLYHWLHFQIPYMTLAARGFVFTRSK